MCEEPVLILSVTGLSYVTECWFCQNVVAEEPRKVNKKIKGRTWDFLLVLSVGQNWLPNSPDLKIQKHFLGVF